MFAPILTGILLSLVMIGISLKKPNTGRIILGIFFLVMAIGVNGTFTLFNPQSYVDYSQGALLSIYRELGTNIISLNPAVFGSLLIVYETAIGLLMLHKGKFVKAGMIGSILFLIAIAPVSLIQITWLGLAITPAYLLTKNFEISLWEIMRSKFSKE